MLKQFVRRLRALVRQRETTSAMDDEMRFHLEMEEAELRARGVSAEEARRLARVRFGGVERFREEGWDATGVRWLADLAQDARYALRTLRRTPVFTAVAIVTLALGIGATTALFSAVDGIVVRPLNYDDPSRIIRLLGTQRVGGGRETMAYMDVLDFRAQSTTLEDVAAYDEWTAMLTGDGAPERLDAASVTSPFFRVLGVQPAVGRFFRADEDVPDHAPVVVLGHALWRRRFGGDAGALGKSVRINGVSYTIIGVAPADFEDPRLSGVSYDPPQLWRVTPRYFNPTDSPRGSRAFTAIARLKPGVTTERAERELGTIASRLETQYPGSNDGRGVRAVVLKEQIVGRVKPALLVLLGATGLLVLVACVNLANLLLARAADREREMALRTALGAGRGRLARQLLAESLVLASLGGAFGIVLGRWATSAIVLFAGDSLARPDQVRMDGRVLAFAAGATILTGLLFGLAPALKSHVTQLHAALKEGARATASGKALQFRGVLVAAEVALSLVLLAGAGLLARSLWNLQNVDPGFRAENVLTLQLDPPSPQYDSATAVNALYAAVLERARAVPGVREAATVDILPMSGSFSGMTVTFPDRPTPPPSEQPSVEIRGVSTRLFAAFGIPIVRGRDFTQGDRDGAAGVMIVDELSARRFWPGQDPIGKDVVVFSQRRWRVVGVVGAVRQFTLEQTPEPTIYVPSEQVARFLGGTSILVVRTDADPMSLAPSIRAAVAGVDGNVAISRVVPAERVVGATLRQQRLRAGLLGLFACIAFVIGAVGVYGVAAYGVSRRTTELGIRMALGACGREILMLVVGQSIRPALLGLAVGLVVSLAAARALTGLLYGVSAADPFTFVLAAVALGGTALLATYLPARRAAKLDPMTALRSE